MSHGSATDFAKFETILDADALRGVAALTAETCGDQVQRMLADAQVAERLRTDGLVVLSGLDALPSPDWSWVFVAICGALGKLQPQGAKDSGQVVREVRYRRGSLQERTVRYSDSRSGGSYHSDGVPVPGPLPDVLALLCVRPAPRGGELVFVDSTSALEAATHRMPGLPAALSRDFHFDQRREDDPTATAVRRIVERHEGEDRLVYLRDYVESGHRIAGVRPLAADEIEAMDVLDEVLADEALHIEGRLAPGQIAINDNHRFVHGRHEFPDEQDEQGGRLMLRCWIRASKGE
ncbi:TauD/TfdA family dioxygenase [Catenulispora pinisilvae]|uniref:TauD/TfdA family dioxygenase n=1 Tax=Catenulispora pinisilvae TaxID=2705253 RepID=UPI0018915789|nr:TauD/TfdA family dioxygenase [Catenulispora pinisilvae]